MNATRRNFMKGILALSVVSVAPNVLANVPIIYSDGVHDDYAGLRAMFDGKPFRVQGDVIIAEGGYIKGGNFVLSETLDLSNVDGFFIEKCCFRTTQPDWSETLMSVGRLSK